MIREERNKIDTKKKKKKQEKINEAKIWFLKKINEIDKLQSGKTKRRERTQNKK